MQRTLAMIVLIIASFMDLMDTTVVNVALPSIRAELGMNPAQLEWVVNAYILGIAATLILGGRLGDLFGRRTIFVIGVVGFTLASLASAAAGSGSILISARALQGAFAGLMVPQVLASVHDLYEPAKRGPIFGLVGFITGTASVVGPVLAGWLVSSDAFAIGWRSIFAINVPIGTALTIAAILVVPNSRERTRLRLDALGAALATGAAVGVVLPLVEGRQAGWPVWCWASFVVSALLIAGLLLRERAMERGAAASTTAAFLPLHLFRNHDFLAGTVANFSYQAGLASFFLFFALYLQQAAGFDALAAGLTWLGFSLGALLGSVLASTGFAERARRAVMTIGGTLTAVGFLWVAAGSPDPAAHAIPNGWQFTPALAVAGIGLGALIVPLFGATLETVSAADAGAASGTLNMLQQIGGSVGIAAVGVAFFTIATDRPTASSLTSGFHVSAWLAAGLFVCAAVAALTIRSHPHPIVDPEIGRGDSTAAQPGGELSHL